MKKILSFIKHHYLFLIFYALILFSAFYKFPYYIDAPGGLIDVTNRIQIKGGYESKGSFNLAYVSEYEATLPMILLSYLLPSWDLYPKNTETTSVATYDDTLIRDRLWLQQAYADAVILAYQKAGKEVTITKSSVFVLYVAEGSKTDLKMGDQILSVDGTSISSIEELTSYVRTKEVGDIVTMEVLREGKTITRQAEVLEIEGTKLIGIVPSLLREYQTDPEIQLYYEDSESGPSGGLMMALAIYNALVEEDITHGLTIVGTGTIDADGKVGEIGGVDYKLKGASKKADIFFVPAGENYEEAMALKKEKGYDIEIVPVSTFEEALTYLEKRGK